MLYKYADAKDIFTLSEESSQTGFPISSSANKHQLYRYTDIVKHGLPFPWMDRHTLFQCETNLLMGCCKISNEAIIV